MRQVEIQPEVVDDLPHLVQEALNKRMSHKDFLCRYLRNA